MMALNLVSKPRVDCLLSLSYAVQLHRERFERLEFVQHATRLRRITHRRRAQDHNDLVLFPARKLPHCLTTLKLVRSPFAPPASSLLKPLTPQQAHNSLTRLDCCRLPSTLQTLDLVSPCRILPLHLCNISCLRAAPPPFLVCQRARTVSRTCRATICCHPSAHPVSTSRI